MPTIKHFEALVLMFKTIKNPQPSKAHKLRYYDTQIHTRSPRGSLPSIKAITNSGQCKTTPHIPRDIQEVIYLRQSSKSKPVAMRSLGKWANFSPAALRSNLTSAMRLVNQLNSLKTATEFATSQPYGRSGSATLPASGGDIKWQSTYMTVNQTSILKRDKSI